MVYHFQCELSDIDRQVYQTLDFRTAQHPSETLTYLLTRVLAYALSYQDNLAFAPQGLHDPEAPALQAIGSYGAVELWIEVGNPSARKLHKAGKIAQKVLIFTYKNPEILMQEIQANDVHRQKDLVIISFDPAFLQKLEDDVQKKNRWNILYQQGQLDIDTGLQQISTQVKRYGGV